MANSYIAEVQTGGDEWTGNGLRFPDEASAQVYADDLRSRWTLVSATRAVPSDDAPNMDASGSHVETGRSALMGAGHRVKL
jgi:hypothetical protein